MHGSTCIKLYQNRIIVLASYVAGAIMKLRTQVLLVLGGTSLLLLPFFFMSGWLKYLLMFVGSIALQAVWGIYAGTPVAEEEHSIPLAFTEVDYRSLNSNDDDYDDRWERKLMGLDD